MKVPFGVILISPSGRSGSMSSASAATVVSTLNGKFFTAYASKLIELDAA